MEATSEQLRAENEVLRQQLAEVEQERDAARMAQSTAEMERQQMEDLLLQAPAGIALMRGPEHRYVLSNQQNCDIIGRNDVIGKTLIEVVPIAEEQGFTALLDQVYATGEPFIGKEIPVVMQRPGKEKVEETWMDFIYHPIVDTNGDVNGIMVHSVDVTDKVLARQEVETRNAENEQLNSELQSRLEELRQAEAERTELQQQIMGQYEHCCNETQGGVFYFFRMG